MKIHREKKEAPVYILTVAKSGLKINPMKPGSCAAPDPDNCGYEHIERPSSN